MVAFHSTIHYVSITLFLNALPGNLGIDPIWKVPESAFDFTKLHRSADMSLDLCFEFLVEVGVVQKDIWVVKPLVEMSLNRPDRL